MLIIRQQLVSWHFKCLYMELSLYLCYMVLHGNLTEELITPQCPVYVLLHRERLRPGEFVLYIIVSVLTLTFFAHQFIIVRSFRLRLTFPSHFLDASTFPALFTLKFLLVSSTFSSVTGVHQLESSLVLCLMHVATVLRQITNLTLLNSL